MTLVEGLERVRGLSEQKRVIDEKIFEITKKAERLSGRVHHPTLPAKVAELADRYTPTLQDEAVKEFAQKAGKGLKQKIAELVGEFIKTAR